MDQRSNRCQIVTSVNPQECPAILGCTRTRLRCLTVAPVTQRAEHNAVAQTRLQTLPAHRTSSLASSQHLRWRVQRCRSNVRYRRCQHTAPDTATTRPRRACDEDQQPIAEFLVRVKAGTPPDAGSADLQMLATPGGRGRKEAGNG
ncbi:hypothetical protein NDU88_001603 [Pleurodeles waltl]|uniref:Uncharacterized protein n=1 Tax=Pleurodeles waltl TaxID=8319 RepID=A0AAV7U820_PLEWA|nr:hypothetical protein NDU88_001603 [Pleurodeles waltl]